MRHYSTGIVLELEDIVPIGPHIDQAIDQSAAILRALSERILPLANVPAHEDRHGTEIQTLRKSGDRGSGGLLVLVHTSPGLNERCECTNPAS